MTIKVKEITPLDEGQHRVEFNMVDGVTVSVVLPAADTARAKQIYENMARELAFDPRRDMGA